MVFHLFTLPFATSNMAPSILERDLDEFGLRYLESCQEVLNIQTCPGMFISRLSSPLQVMDVSVSADISGTRAVASFEGISETRPKHLDLYSEPARSSPTFDNDSTSESVSSSQSPMSSSQSPISVIPLKAVHCTSAERAFTKLRGSRPKTSTKHLGRLASMGNPFYKKGSCLGNSSSGNYRTLGLQLR